MLKRILLSSIVIVLAAIVIAVYATNKYLDTPLSIEGEGVDVSLVRGGSLGTVSFNLAEQGVLQRPLWLKIYTRLSGRGASIKAGEYFLAQGTTPRVMLDKLESGDVKYYQLTLVEGWNLQQVVHALKSQPYLLDQLADTKVSQLASVLNIDEGDNQIIPISQSSMEGLLFPDTYRYHGAASNVEVLEQAYLRMQTVLKEEWENRQSDLPYESAYEALIMASLIEKETGAASERPEIAGVFVRRLNKGMRLQTDPAVIYGLGEGFDGNLRTRHLKDSSNVFNTYRHHGLPPTPIALVGREAIHAALHPADGDTLYFVAKGDGTHYFSRTLEEHQKAVQKFQIEQRRKDYSSSPPSNNNG
jgi:UPF0755 protein